jgi:dihydroorotase
VAATASWSVAAAPTARSATLSELVGWMSANPAGIGALDRSGQGGPIAAGTAANLCIFDLTARWTVERRGGASRSENTPFAGQPLIGRVRHTVYRGEPVVIDGKAQR